MIKYEVTVSRIGHAPTLFYVFAQSMAEARKEARVRIGLFGGAALKTVKAVLA